MIDLNVEIDAVKHAEVIRGDKMNGNDQFLGIVKSGQFQMLWPEQLPGGSVRLTTIQMQESVPPDSAELDLTEYEGGALMARGYFGGGWIYSAHIVEAAGPILTAVVKQVFGPNELAEH